MTKTELLEIINNGENSGVEFKRDTTDQPALAKELVAFANLQGGCVLLGVDDDRSVFGLTRPYRNEPTDDGDEAVRAYRHRKLEEWVMQACREKVRPELIPYFEIIREVERGKDIAIVQVERGWTVHHVWHDQHRTYYIRVGSTSREASPEELERLFQQRGAFRLEIRPVSGSSTQDLDRRRLRDYFERLRSQRVPPDQPSAEWREQIEAEARRIAEAELAEREDSQWDEAQGSNQASPEWGEESVADAGRIAEAELAERADSKWNESIEAQATRAAPEQWKEIVENRERQWYEEMEEDWQRLLVNTEILDESEKHPATVAALLLFGENPNKFLPQAGIDAAAYPGIEKDYGARERQQLRGPMVVLRATDGSVAEAGIVEQAVAFVRRNTEVTGYLQGGARRQEQWAYPVEAVREAIVNALVHRDYLLSGTNIEISIYANRLEVVSPGRLPNGITPERMRTGCRSTRNQLLKDVMWDYGYLEHMGMGVPRKIVKGMRESNGTEPDLIEDGEMFIVRLWKEPSVQ